MTAAPLAALALTLACCAPAAAAPSPAADPPRSAACHPSGCSGQVCSDEPVITTCEWKPEYDCYREATCARAADGACGWVMDEALRACLERARKDGGREPRSP